MLCKGYFLALQLTFIPRHLFCVNVTIFLDAWFDTEAHRLACDMDSAVEEAYTVDMCMAVDEADDVALFNDFAQVIFSRKLIAVVYPFEWMMCDDDSAASEVCSEGFLEKIALFLANPALHSVVECAVQCDNTQVVMAPALLQRQPNGSVMPL